MKLRLISCLYANPSHHGFTGRIHNGAERSLRGVAVGRKNWMFYGSDHGGRTAAVLSSLIATCKRLDVDSFAYLRDILGRISGHPQTRLAELLPDQWQAAYAEDCGKEGE